MMGLLVVLLSAASALSCHSGTLVIWEPCREVSGRACLQSYQPGRGGLLYIGRQYNPVNRSAKTDFNNLNSYNPIKRYVTAQCNSSIRKHEQLPPEQMNNLINNIEALSVQSSKNFPKTIIENNLPFDYFQAPLPRHDAQQLVLKNKTLHKNINISGGIPTDRFISHRDKDLILNSKINSNQLAQSSGNPWNLQKNEQEVVTDRLKTDQTIHAPWDFSAKGKIELSTESDSPQHKLLPGILMDKSRLDTDEKEMSKMWKHLIKKRQDYAMMPWSPLKGHVMNIVCPMQDDYLERMDLSSLNIPAWLRTHRDPVGRCPVKYHVRMDERRIWPPVLITAECVCERSRCTKRGPHICITVYVARTVLKAGIGVTKELVSVDCICAARTAKLIKFTRPKIVS